MTKTKFDKLPINIPERFSGRNYEIIPWVNNQQALYYQQFGSYSGEWLMLATDGETYFLYKGSYGSCSGCDSYEAEFAYDMNDLGLPELRKKALNFAKDYIPFAKIPRATMRNLVDRGTLAKILPANIRTGYSEIPWDEAIEDMTVIVKLFEGMDITKDNILKCRNAEVKQKALKAMGYEKFVVEAKPELLDEEGENKLLKIDDIVFVYVKDASTPRRYLLRVHPNMQRVKEAIAWTFDLQEEEYQPLIET